jgi:hypothetical protein
MRWRRNFILLFTASSQVLLLIFTLAIQVNLPTHFPTFPPPDQTVLRGALLLFPYSLIAPYLALYLWLLHT